MERYHTSVLLQEAIDALNVKIGQKYIDATVGGGGHTEEILKRGGIVLGIDTDLDAIEYVQKESGIRNQESGIEKRLTLVHGNFKDIKNIALEHGFEKVSGILFDLGVSSFQLDNPEKGFSFLRNGPLDMRMDKNLGVRAADLVNALSEKELVLLFRRFGEEKNSLRIAKAIVQKRKNKPFETTSDLVTCMEGVYNLRGEVSNKKKAEISKRVFLALRIAVNDELGVLTQALQDAKSLLKSNGRLAVITFHSLEDRVVKQAFLKIQTDGFGTIITKKPIMASAALQNENSRSRSAKLRVFIKE